MNTARLRRRLAALTRSAQRQRLRGDYKAAEAGFRDALRLVTRSGLLSERLALWNELGMTLKYAGKFDAAEHCYQRALRSVGHCPEGEERDCFSANLYHNLGGVEHSRGRFLRAERYARKGLGFRLRCESADSLAVASDRGALAAILDGLHKYSESEKHYRHVLKIYRREYGASHPEIAVALNNLAALYQATGRPRQAEKHYHAALRMKRRELGDSHPDLAVTMNNLAMFYQSRGNNRRARIWSSKAVCLAEKALGRSHPTTRIMQSNHRRLGV